MENPLPGKEKDRQQRHKFFIYRIDQYFLRVISAGGKSCQPRK
jgi:hypothetical protein